MNALMISMTLLGTSIADCKINPETLQLEPIPHDLPAPTLHGDHYDLPLPTAEHYTCRMEAAERLPGWCAAQQDALRQGWQAEKEELLDAIENPPFPWSEVLTAGVLGIAAGVLTAAVLLR